MQPTSEPHGPAMIVRIARIEAHSTPRMTRAEINGSLFGGPPVTRIIWELPGPSETSWLVQVPEELAAEQLRRFAHLRIAADVVGFRSLDPIDADGDPGPEIDPGRGLPPLRHAS